LFIRSSPQQLRSGQFLSRQERLFEGKPFAFLGGLGCTRYAFAFKALVDQASFT
jgi:hypothetical protein